MARNRIVTAVEIGTAKVQALIGEVSPDGNLSVIGDGRTTSAGVLKGRVVDVKAAGNCVEVALMAAERTAGVSVDNVFVAQSGPHVRGRFNTGGANISASNGLVSEADVLRAQTDAKGVTLQADRVYIHHIRNPFMLDGAPVSEPVGRQGRRLEAAYWAVEGSRQIIQEQLRMLAGIDINVRDLILSSIASAAATIGEGHKENGCLILDIGAGTTDYALYQSGYIVRAGVLPVGGDHITNDLSTALRVNRQAAEDFKLRHGRAFPLAADKDSRVFVIGDRSIGDRERWVYETARVIEARLRELFTLIVSELSEVWDPGRLGAGVFLTGGTARLPGISELAAKAFNVRAEMIAPPESVGERLSHPEYSTALGLLIYGARLDEEEGDGAIPVRPPNWLNRLTRVFRVG